MMLRTLEKYDERTASGILADLVLASFTTNPGVGTAARYEEVADSRVAEILAELRLRLKLSPQDNSVEAVHRIREALSSALSASALRGKDPKEISARAGTGGRLPVSMYRVELSAGFMRLFNEFAVRETHVRETIMKADEYQHLMTEDIVKNKDLFSMFLKWYAGKRKEDSYWSLVTTFRRGASLIAQQLWRVYPSDVPLSITMKPVEILKAFCETFGLDVLVGGQRAKFHLQQRMAKLIGKPEGSVEFAVEPNAEHIAAISMRTEPEDPFFDVGIVYAIDKERYKQSLRRHGVILP